MTTANGILDASALNDIQGSFNLRGGPLALDPTGATDSSAALQAALDAIAANPLYTQTSVDNAGVQVPVCGSAILPAGDYRVNTPLRLPRGVDLVISEGARLKAGAAMAYLIDTDKSVRYQKQSVDIRGLLDCNGLADVGFYPRYFANLRIPTAHIANALVSAIVLGDPTATATSYKPVVSNLDISRSKGSGVPANSIGLHVQYATDGEYMEGVIQGFDIGVKADRGGNTFSHFHSWGFRDENLNVNFWDTATGNIYIGCSADSPKQHGWRLAGSGTQIIGGRAYRNDYEGDDVGTAVYLTGDTSDPQHFIWPLRVHGVNSSSRWHTDIDALNQGDMRSVTFLIMRANVVTKWGSSTQFGSVPNETTVTIQAPNGGLNSLLSLAASNRQVQRRFVNTGDMHSIIGGQSRTNSTVTVGRSVTNADDTILCNNPSTITMTLPAANSGSISSGRTYTFRSINSGSVTVASSGGNVDGAASATVAAGAKATFMSDGTNWWSV